MFFLCRFKHKRTSFTFIRKNAPAQFAAQHTFFLEGVGQVSRRELRVKVFSSLLVLGCTLRSRGSIKTESKVPTDATVDDPEMTTALRFGHPERGEERHLIACASQF